MLDNDRWSYDVARTQKMDTIVTISTEAMGLMATGRHIPNTMQPLLTLIKRCLTHTTCVWLGGSLWCVYVYFCIPTLMFAYDTFPLSILGIRKPSQGYISVIGVTSIWTRPRSGSEGRCFTSWSVGGTIYFGIWIHLCRQNKSSDAVVAEVATPNV